MKSNSKRVLLFVVLAIFSAQLHAQSKKQIQQIRSSYNLSKLQKVESNIKYREKIQHAEVVRVAKQKGWDIEITTKDGRYMQLQKVVDGMPIYYTTFNVAAAKSTRTDHLNASGSLGLNLMGQNMTAHVWDGGVARATHQEYDGAGGNNRFSVGDGSRNLNFHAAHVTGTIMASGVRAEAKGMAPHAKAIGYFWDNDTSEAAAAAANGMIISNHSYGFAIRNRNGQVQIPQHFFGGYIDNSRDWDAIMFNAPNYLMVVAGGNDGRDNTANNNPTGGSGWDKLTGHSTSKNNLVVANAQDANISNNGSLISVTINSSSSEGPTDDLRVKPDIAGNGTGVFSTYDNNNTAYNSITGTSMASPNVAGSLLLLQQYYNQENGNFMKASTLKGLALHTADDAGATGPDAVFGWGLLNAKRAAETITKNGDQAEIEELILADGQSYTITVNSDGTSPLLASISWTDRPGEANTIVNSRTPVLVNDLDIRVSKENTEYLPYKLTGPTTSAKRDNNVDPFERVDVSNASGTYTITVTHKGSLVGGSQAYSLIVTGASATTANPGGDSNSDTQAPTIPGTVQVSNIETTTATINWSASEDNVGVVAYNIYQGANSIGSVTGTTTNVTGLVPATSYSFGVTAIDAAGNESAQGSVSFTTLSDAPAPTNYCASKGDRSQFEWIDNIELGGIANATGNDGGYRSFISQVGTLARGSSNTMIVSAGFSGRAYTEFWSVWIDFNRNGTFETGEQVVSGSSSSANNLSATVAVPSNASLGLTRMRVSMKYNAAQGPCETFNDGEVEDYTINITAATNASLFTTFSTTSADPLGRELAQSYIAFPNPATDLINVSLSNRFETLNSYKVRNLLGQIVSQGIVTDESVNVSSLPSGVYILETNDGQKTFVTKLIKK